MNVAPVPDAYVGLWRRTLLERPAVRDITSSVFWLQTKTWHADIRVPADRPALAGHTSLETLPEAALLALARQQGFAGITEVNGELCRWHRQMDYQPPSGFNDIGRMQFETPDRLLEHGVEQRYFEVWERVPRSSGASSVTALETASDRRTLLLIAGSWFIRVRPRHMAALPPAAGLGALVAAAVDDEERQALLDFEISLGRRDSDGTWRIELSTLPWREGQPVAVPVIA